jgi:hypothetical protein
MTEKFQDRLRQHALKNFVGRQQQLSKLREVLESDEALVIFIYGIGGIGKTSLLDMFSSQAQGMGDVVITLDCRMIRPSSDGFLQEVQNVTGSESATLEDVTSRLSQMGPRVILALDTYEVFRMMDTWLRQVFIPALSDNVRLLIFGREAPVSSWYTTPGWQSIFKAIPLGPLNPQEAETLLQNFGVAQADRPRVVQFTSGHPLALTLAAAAMAERPDLTLKEVESQRVIAELTQVFLSDVTDAVARSALEAASVVRRTTLSLLAAMLPDIPASEAYAQLEALPFVERASDGLLMHDLVQQAIASHLRATDPDRYATYRRAAWNRLRSEFTVGSRTTVWRYTADMIYLIDHPAIHGTFFPSDAHLYAVEPATENDFGAIRAIVLQHDGPEMLDILQKWWHRRPEAFYTARGRDNDVAGYYAMLQVYQTDDPAQYDDPMTGAWWQQMQTNPVADGHMVLFVLRWIAKDTGEAPSAVQGALWLDIKRAYMQYPQTRRLYGILHDTKTWMPIFGQLGFQRLDTNLTFDGKTFAVLMNDFGPQLVPGWMAGLVDTQLGIERQIHLDKEAHELVLDGERIGLTRLEFSLLCHLSEHHGKAVSRDELLSKVWGYDYDGGSNVVDAMVRSLRKKMGDHAACIETVSGVGYRLRWSR